MGLLSYRHRYCFWVLTNKGGFAGAAETPDIAVPAIVARVRELNGALGHQLHKPAGRGLALTEAGRAAFARSGRACSRSAASAPTTWA